MADPIELPVARRVAGLRRCASDQRDAAIVLRILGADGEAARARELAMAIDVVADVLERRSNLAKETPSDRPHLELLDPRD